MGKKVKTFANYAHSCLTLIFNNHVRILLKQSEWKGGVPLVAIRTQISVQQSSAERSCRKGTVAPGDGELEWQSWSESRPSLVAMSEFWTTAAGCATYFTWPFFKYGGRRAPVWRLDLRLRFWPLLGTDAPSLPPDLDPLFQAVKFPR
jgi:hypothetical protein